MHLFSDCLKTRRNLGWW